MSAGNEQLKEMKDTILSLVYSDYDSVEYYFFKSPTNAVTEEEFKKICDQLIPKAGYRAVIRKQLPKEPGDYVCWRDVVESLVSLLEEQGYQRIFLEDYHFKSVGHIIYEDTRGKEQLGFATDLIIGYNRKLEKKIAEERKTRKKLSGLLKKKTVQIIK